MSISYDDYVQCLAGLMVATLNISLNNYDGGGVQCRLSRK